MAKYLPPKQAAEALGVSIKTLRRWESSGLIQAARTAGGHRRFDIESARKGSSQPPPQDNSNVLNLFNPNYPAIENWRFRTTHHFAQSLNRGNHNLGKLRRLAFSVPGQKARKKIARGVLNLKWRIEPPVGTESSPDIIARINNSINRPNIEDHSRYSLFIKALILDLLTAGFAAVERQPASEPERFFWMWLINPEYFTENNNWNYDARNHVFRYFDTNGAVDPREWTGFYSDEAFIIQEDACSWQRITPSVFSIACDLIEDWLEVKSYQKRATSNSNTRDILLFEDCNKQELDAFRLYWETEVAGSGKMPIFRGKMNKITLAAQSNEDLYLQYCEYLLKMIAAAFDISHRDFNITDHDNRATANVSANTTFQDAVLPYANLIKEIINTEILGHFEELRGYRFEYNDTEPRNENEEASRVSDLFEKGIYTLNEARRELGKPEFKDGNVLFDGRLTEEKL